MDTVDVFSITDVERLTGIKAHTIRIWEKRYGIPEAKRTVSNIRYFNNDEVRLLLTIRMLNSYGLKISVIAAMSVSERDRHLHDVLKARGGVHDHVDELLVVSLLDSDEWKFTEVFSAAVVRFGMEGAFTDCLLPFFERVGILWQTGTIEPAQEHFFFHLVRQKLMAETVALGVSSDKGTPAVLLFLPEHELHELALLFYNYAFRARGFRTYYLGQSVPMKGLDQMIKTVRPDYIVTGLTNTMNPVDPVAFRLALQKIAGKTKIFFTGPVFTGLKNKMGDISTAEDLAGFLKSTPNL